MAVPTKGSVKTGSPTPGGSNPYTFSNVTVNSGNNRLLVLQLTTNDLRNHNSVTYGTGAAAQSMTSLFKIHRGGLDMKMSFWYLENPNVGTANAIINLGGSMYNPISICFRAFTDSGGIGNHVNTNGGSSPRTGNITVEQDSLIMMTSSSTTNIQTQQIPTGTNQSFVSHNINRRVGCSAISSNAGHNAGSISTRATAGSNLTMDRVEIKGINSSDTGADNFFLIM